MSATADERELDELLDLIEKHMDLDHNREVDARHRRALEFQPTDQPPLFVQAPFGSAIRMPEPWARFRHYSYRQTFEDPAAMMQNHLLERVVPGILLKDDSPLPIRNNHGTIQIASLLGGRWEQREDEYPWIWKCGSREVIEKIAYGGAPDLSGGVMPRSLKTLEFYRGKLASRPKCKAGIQISIPDMQGPIDVAEQLWGSDIFYSFAESPELLSRLLARVVEATLLAWGEFRRLAADRMEPFAHTQHGTVIPGRLLIRDDSSIMLSAGMYAEFVRPHDERLLREAGTGSIHFCGNGAHLVPKMLEIPGLRGLDFGQPQMMDIAEIHARCCERKVAVVRLPPSREDLIGGKAQRDFATGVSFQYSARDLGDAAEVVRAYRSHAI